MLTADKTARFWAKVNKGGADECWPWTGAKNPDGYGRFAAVGRVLFSAHRVSYELAGRRIPSGMVVDHICRNRGCVNPAHLRAITHGRNIFENSEALAALNARKTHCPQGHPYSGDNLVLRLDRRRGCRLCRNEHQRRRRARKPLPPKSIAG
jgi:hypothetical protein